MNTNICIRKATKNSDCNQLTHLYNTVFYPEEVGVLSKVMYNHLPGIKKEYWHVAEDTSTNKIISAFGLIPWKWEIKGIPLKIAEMGLVATYEEYRNRGLMKLLNSEFDKTVSEEKFDLSVIQGIPGFYHKFGYHYSLSLESHINMPLHLVTDSFKKPCYSFRLATKSDIQFLLNEDKKYRNEFFISSFRNEENWEYLLSESKKTEYGSEFWLMEDKTDKKKFYFRISLHGFGNGLIISEVSSGISLSAFYSILHFCKQKATERNKPYIRLNIHNESEIGKMAISMGLSKCKLYAWQIKIPDNKAFLMKIKPILEHRLINSCFRNYSGCLRINLYRESLDIFFNKGKITAITDGTEKSPEHIFFISHDMFAPLVLGHRSWQEIQYIRPDVYPDPLYELYTVESISNMTGLLIDTLFPKEKSWIYCEY